jgi:16S rRNA (adenine1518-N6/adenine1519-N6)-dimethyltransferase
MEHRPKKCFGQNFLRDRQVVEQIIAAAELQPVDRVLEIGPGLGVLTDRMLPLVREVVVIEVDRDLAAGLRSRQAENLTVHEGDVLSLHWDNLLPSPPYKLVANLPYNISSQILFRILDQRQRLGRLILMFQKEVGDRLAASPGTKDYGILSVFCQLWFDIRRVTLVPPGAFYPPPKVTSVVLSFEPLQHPRVAIKDEDFFRRVVKAAFAQRRKTLRNSLMGSGFDAMSVDRALDTAGIDPVRRGETLSLEDFARLSEALQSVTR